jgi:hypothetical protein
VQIIRKQQDIPINSLVTRREQHQLILDRLVQQQYWRAKPYSLLSTGKRNQKIVIESYIYILIQNY